MELAAAAERPFYFTRKSRPNAMSADWLVSGVVVATSAADAESKLNELLEKLKRIDRGRDFSFADLTTIEVSEHGIAVITMGNR